MISLRILMLFLFIANIVYAQTIGGRISGVNKKLLSGVSVVLQKGNNIIGATATDNDGRFRLAVQLENRQLYMLHMSLVGYHSLSFSFSYPDTSLLDQLVLEENKKLLAEITVTGRPPLLIRKSDRNIINVENSALANGFSAVEVLQRSPGVWVDNMDNIRLKGNQPVTIMVNDVVQRLGDEELADFLRSLKSDEISRIEIIPNPPSEFEAGGSGGIIHIFLKKSKKNRWSGSLNTEYWQQADKPYFTTGAILNYQLNKLYLSGSYAYTRDLRNIAEKTSITYPDFSSFEKAERHDLNNH